MSNAAILLAAGRGTRLQSKTSDKILAQIAGRPIIRYSLDAFVRSKTVDTIVIVTRDAAQRAALEEAIADTLPSEITILWTQGGTERQDSVLNGLECLPENTDLVFIHDAARPLITPTAIRLLANAANQHGAAAQARRVTDTIKQVEPANETENLFRPQTVDRSKLWAMETPQVFRYTLILDAYRRLREAGTRVTDDTSALEPFNHPVALVESETPNPKLTTPADLPLLEFLLTHQNLFSRSQDAEKANDERTGRK